MTRPNTNHKGFMVPNAVGVLDPVMSEPDQIDYNISGNGRWGVVSGCEVTVSTGTVAEVTGGIAVVDGLVVDVIAGQTIGLGSGSAQARFDLVGVNQAGTLTVVVGAPAAEPLFPDPPTSFTALAAVLAPPGTASFGDYVVDKRNFLQPVLVGTGSGDTTLILNRSEGADTFRLSADGTMVWGGDAALQRKAVGVLEVLHSLDLQGDIIVRGGTSLVGDVAIEGNLTSKNFVRNDTFPTTAEDGTLLVRNGLIYGRRSGLWEQMLSTGTGGDQVGDIKQTMRTPAQMPGWLQMIGQTIQEDNADFTQLFGVVGLEPYISGVAPNRVMTLPDATNRFLLGSTVAGEVGGSNSLTLGLEHMPTHKHDVAIQSAGLHNHDVALSPAGAHQHYTIGEGHSNNGNNQTSWGTHSHGVGDQGHSHEGVDGWGGETGNNFIGAAWTGGSKLDGPINDGSHTWTVEGFPRTVRSQSGISVGTTGSEHVHLTETSANHQHVATATSAGTHNHTLTEALRGGGSPVAVQPRYLTVFVYIKL